MAEVRGVTFKVEGLEELQAQFGRISKMPKKYLTKSAREGMAGPEKDAKASVPYKSGTLKKSIKKKLETPNKRKKAVYRLRYDPKFTQHFLKESSGAYGGEPPVAYYPASIEYGFKTAKGKVPGQFNLAKAIKKHEKDSLQKVIKSLSKSIDELSR